MSDQNEGKGQGAPGVAGRGSGDSYKTSWIDFRQQIPVILITLVVGYFIYDASNDNSVASRLGQLDGRLEVIDNRIEGIEGRFASIEQGIERGRQDAQDRLDLADRTNKLAQDTVALISRQIAEVQKTIDRDVNASAKAAENLSSEVLSLREEVAKLRDETEKRDVLKQFFRDDRNRGTLFMLISRQKNDADDYTVLSPTKEDFNISYMIDGRYVDGTTIDEISEEKCVYRNTQMFGIKFKIFLPCPPFRVEVFSEMEQSAMAAAREYIRYFLVNTETGEVVMRF